MQFDSVSRFIGRFVQFHGDPIRTRSPCAIAVILPAVARPETHAADDVIGAFHFQAVGPHSTGKLTFAVCPACRSRDCSPSCRSFDRTATASLRCQTSSSSSRGARESAAPVAQRPLFLAFGIGVDNLKRRAAVFFDHRLFHRTVGAVVVDPLRANSGRIPGSVSAGQIGCCTVRVTGRPPDSSRLACKTTCAANGYPATGWR